MANQAIKSKICAEKLIAIVRTDTADNALAVVEALAAGGVEIIEITMTVPGALAAIRQVADKYGDRLALGAGTVVDETTARLAILAGAKFLVSPVFDQNLLAMAHRYSVCMIPGCLTPTEVLSAWTAGADLIKVFPCDMVGGQSYIKALKGPFPQIDLVPTGGVNLTTAGQYLQAGASALGLGTALVPSEMVRTGRFEDLTERARQYRSVVETFLQDKEHGHH